MPTREHSGERERTGMAGGPFAAGLLVLVAIGCAGSPGPKGEPVRGPGGGDPASAGFGAFDRDGDGILTHDEYRQASAELFSRIDENRDGVLSGPELDRFPPSVRAQLDRNRDGRISLEEFLAAASSSFATCDADRDGRITPDEARRCAPGEPGP